MVQAMPGLTHPASRAISSCLKIKLKKIEEAGLKRFTTQNDSCKSLISFCKVQVLWTSCWVLRVLLSGTEEF